MKENPDNVLRRKLEELNSTLKESTRLLSNMRASDFRTKEEFEIKGRLVFMGLKIRTYFNKKFVSVDRFSDIMDDYKYIIDRFGGEQRAPSWIRPNLRRLSMHLSPPSLGEGLVRNKEIKEDYLSLINSFINHYVPSMVKTKN